MAKTEQKTEAHNVELKNVKVYDHMSRETVCFLASLWIDGRRVGSVENDGQGGCHRYDYRDAEMRDLARATDDWARTLPEVETEWGISFKQDLDWLVGEQVTNHQYKKICTRKTLFKLRLEHKEDIYEIKVKYTPQVGEWLREKYGEDLLEIINERFTK